MKRKFDSFISIFENAMREYPDKKAVIVEKQVRTYREIYENARCIAAYVMQRGIKKGDPVAIISNNSADYIETVLGCIMAGAIVVKLNWRLAAPELEYLMQFNHVKLVFFRSQNQQIRAEMESLTKTECLAVDMDSLESIIKTAQPIEQFVERADADVLMHLHTSGTTGFPKVVRYTNAQFLEELEICVDALGFDRNTVFQMMSQLFHSASVGIYACLASGSTIVLFPKFEVEEYLASVKKNQVTRMSAIPTVLTTILNNPNLHKYDLSTIKMISYSTCPMPQALLKRAIEEFHCKFQQSYGMTEMCSVVTILTPEDHMRDHMKYLNSVGKPISRHRVCVVDEAGKRCKVGETGEICVKGPGMMLDYYKMPEETEKVIRNGWYHTGDMGVLDEEGYLYVKGRKNDMIISGGENIFPQEIENVLRKNDKIKECYVLGVEDPYWGEAVHACVILKENQVLSEEGIRAYCRGKIAGYKIPKKVHILDAFPRTATGKVLRSELLKRVGEYKE